MRYKLLVLICIVSLITPTVFAYDFVDPNNKGKVYSDRDEIHNLKNMYQELAGEDEEEEEEIVYQNVNNASYWWPIGSEEVTNSNGKAFAMGTPEDTTITSYFGYRDAIYQNGVQITNAGGHGALDIANYKGAGGTSVISAKDGVVVYPTDGANVRCVNQDKSCNGYGNYVIISHADGNYTLYAHLYANSILVKAGDSVQQGQVIAKVGSSGNSTGPHLHFEVRAGENTSSARVDPLDYVDKDNPRPSASNYLASGDLSSTIDFIRYWEGVGCGSSYETETEYIACNGGDGVITIGHGVTWEYNMDAFIKRGVTSMSAGTKVSKTIVDEIELEAMDNKCGDSIRKGLADAGIDDIKDYQMTALISRCYNGGYGMIKGTDYAFIPAYLKYHGQYRYEDIYSNNGSIWHDAMSHPVMPNSIFEVGLKRRRVSEWRLFTTGVIDYLESDFNPNRYAWDDF